MRLWLKSHMKKSVPDTRLPDKCPTFSPLDVRAPQYTDALYIERGIG